MTEDEMVGWHHQLDGHVKKCCLPSCQISADYRFLSLTPCGCRLFQTSYIVFLEQKGTSLKFYINYRINEREDQ